MDARLIAAAEDFRQAERRLLDIGLVVDPAVLSREHRRALVALRRLEDRRASGTAPTPAPARIGFAYPNPRRA